MPLEFDTAGWFDLIRRKIDGLPEVATLQTPHGATVCTQMQLYAALGRCSVPADYVALNALVSNGVR